MMHNFFRNPEDLMKSISIILLSTLMIFAVGLFQVEDAAADEKTCVLKADAKISLTVWDEDSGEDRQGKIYAGELESGQRHELKSKTGFIVFSYRRAGDDRSYGDNRRNCKNGNIIRVP